MASIIPVSWFLSSSFKVQHVHLTNLSSVPDLISSPEESPESLAQPQGRTKMRMQGHRELPPVRNRHQLQLLQVHLVNIPLWLISMPRIRENAKPWGKLQGNPLITGSGLWSMQRERARKWPMSLTTKLRRTTVCSNGEAHCKKETWHVWAFWHSFIRVYDIF